MVPSPLQYVHIYRHPVEAVAGELAIILYVHDEHNMHVIRQGWHISDACMQSELFLVCDNGTQGCLALQRVSCVCPVNYTARSLHLADHF